MVTTTGYRQNRPLNPLHAILLGFPVALFTGALLSDYAYWLSFEPQWSNFSSWLIAGGLVPAGLVLLWVFVGLVRAGSSRMRRSIVYFLVLLAMWSLGFVNALVHAKDAWAKMPTAVVLSAVVWLLALVAAWIGYSGVPQGEDR